MAETTCARWRRKSVTILLDFFIVKCGRIGIRRLFKMELYATIRRAVKFEGPVTKWRSVLECTTTQNDDA